MDTLKKCPHCNGSAQTFHDRRLMRLLLWGVECVDCGALVWVLPEETEADAIYLWNKRAEPKNRKVYVPARGDRLYQEKEGCSNGEIR